MVNSDESTDIEVYIIFSHHSPVGRCKGLVYAVVNFCNLVVVWVEALASSQVDFH